MATDEQDFEIAVLYDAEKKINRHVFLHDYLFVLSTQKPIPKDKLVVHCDKNTLNNESENLVLVDAPGDIDEYHKKENRVFHQDQYSLSFLQEHFPDILKYFV